MTDIVERLRAGADRVDAAMGLYPDATAMREAADEIEQLREVVAESPDRWSFDTLLWVGRRILAEMYPPDIFGGSSSNSGPQYVVALREAIKRIDDEGGKP